MRDRAEVGAGLVPLAQQLVVLIFTALLLTLQLLTHTSTKGRDAHPHILEALRRATNLSATQLR